MNAAQATFEGAVARLTGDTIRRVSIFRDTGRIISMKGWNTNNQPLFVKFFPGPQGGAAARDEYDALLRYHDSMRGHGTCKCQKPIGIFRDDEFGSVLLFEWTTARRGDRYFKLFVPFGFLRRRGIASTAEWLSTFHQIGGISYAPLQDCLDGDRLVSDLTALAALAPNLTKLGHSAVQDFAQLVERNASTPVTCAKIHADFLPINIFITGKEVIGFDFTAHTTGPVLVDIARFLTALIWYGSLDLTKSQGEKFLADVGVFMDSYSRQVAADTPDIQKIFYVKALVDSARGLHEAAQMGSARKRMTKRKHLRMMTQVLAHVLNGA
jgi:hypothetical protein